MELQACDREELQYKNSRIQTLAWLIENNNIKWITIAQLLERSHSGAKKIRSTKEKAHIGSKSVKHSGRRTDYFALPGRYEAIKLNNSTMGSNLEGDVQRKHGLQNIPFSH